MRLNGMIGSGVAAFLVVAAGGSVSAQDTAPINVTVTGASATGYYRVIVEAFNAIVRDAYPGSAVTFKPSSPAGGLLSIAREKADISVAGGAPEIRAAIAGHAPFPEALRGKIGGVMLLHEKQVVHLLMTRAWADENGIRSFADIARKKPSFRLSMHKDACMQCTLAQAVAIFGQYGFTVGDVEKWGGSIARANGTVGLKHLADGKVDVYINGRFHPDATVADVNRTRPLLWIQADPEKIEAAAQEWGYRKWMVPKGSYEFLDKDYPTIVQWSAMTASMQTSPETVYKFVKALYEGKERMRAIHPSMRNFSSEEMVRIKAELPLHPGAEKFYREVGVLK